MRFITALSITLLALSFTKSITCQGMDYVSYSDMEFDVLGGIHGPGFGLGFGGPKGMQYIDTHQCIVYTCSILSNTMYTYI